MAGDAAGLRSHGTSEGCGPVLVSRVRERSLQPAGTRPPPRLRPASPRLVHISCRVRTAVRARPRPARRPLGPAAAAPDPVGL